MRPVKHEIVKTLAVLNERRGSELRFHRMRWNDGREVFDLRVWELALPYGWIPRMGVCFSEKEARILLRALQGEIEERDTATQGEPCSAMEG